MIRLKYLFQRLRMLRDNEPSNRAPSRQVVQGDTEQVTRTIVERLSEDEMLRGDLTDRGFAPILAFVTSLVPSAASRAASASAEGDVEEAVSHGARGLARAIVAAAETGDTGSLAEQLGPPILPPDAVDRARRSIASGLSASADPDERAIAIVAALRASLEERA